MRGTAPGDTIILSTVRTKLTPFVGILAMD
jgi:hypothetical protein